jgi:hypothetical protein
MTSISLTLLRIEKYVLITAWLRGCNLKAINWLRSKQEESELGYWLSFVAYDPSDRSFLNRMYLFYLLIFFMMWFFVVLIFFAKYSGMILSFINPLNSKNTAVLIELILLAGWNLGRIIQCSKRSPVVFSEQDATLICQTPVSRRHMVLRWIWMPWVKSAIPFWFFTVILGFSIAEIYYSGAIAANKILEYAGFGLNALICLLPIHLTFFILQWVVGVYRLQKSAHRNWIVIPAIILAVLLLITVILSSFSSLSIIKNIISPLEYLLTAGFTGAIDATALLLGTGLALLALGVLFFNSGGFNLSRAAQETSEIDLINTATHYGFTDFVEQRRLQNRLGAGHATAYLPPAKGSAILIWRNIIQASRTFRWKTLLPWITIFGIMMGLPILPTFWSRLLALLFLVFQISPLTSVRLRSDLSCWAILQQLPINKKKILLADLGLSLPIIMLFSIAGLGLSVLVTHEFPFGMILLLPGLLASIACGAAFDILRRSKADLLLTGNAPSVGTQGFLLGLIGIYLPLLIESTVPGMPGTLFSIAASLLIAWLFFQMALRAFRNINA